MEKHIIGENGIGYTLGEDGMYYPDFIQCYERLELLVELMKAGTGITEE